LIEFRLLSKLVKMPQTKHLRMVT